MKRSNRYDVQAAYIPERRPGTNFLAFLWNRIAGLFAQRQRVYVPSAQPLPIYTGGMPSHVADLRRHGMYAHRLLHRHNAGLPTTRRAWMQDGYSDNSWRRSRRILRNAGVTDASGVCLYSGRNAEVRLDAYLRRIEDMCRKTNRYISP